MFRSFSIISHTRLWKSSFVLVPCSTFQMNLVICSLCVHLKLLHSSWHDCCCALIFSGVSVVLVPCFTFQMIVVLWFSCALAQMRISCINSIVLSGVSLVLVPIFHIPDDLFSWSFQALAFKLALCCCALVFSGVSLVLVPYSTFQMIWLSCALARLRISCINSAWISLWSVSFLLVPCSTFQMICFEMTLLCLTQKKREVLCIKWFLNCCSYFALFPKNRQTQSTVFLVHSFSQQRNCLANDLQFWFSKILFVSLYQE